MRVVLVHRYFWPDTPPYAHILKQIALHLGEEGHEVTVLTCQPSYDRRQVRHAPARELIAPGVEVRRWRVFPDRRHSVVKAINLVIFGARLMLAGSRLMTKYGKGRSTSATQPSKNNFGNGNRAL